MDRVEWPNPEEYITGALEQFQPQREQRYAAVTVLLLSWKDNDLRLLDEELQELEDLFRNSFQYLVTRYQIPSKSPQYQLGKHMSDFLIDHGTEGNLIIVYYGGHGSPPKNGSTDCEWAATTKDDSPTLDWCAVQGQLLAAYCDVLIILDCCYAGSAARGTTQHCVEILMAADKDQITPVGVATWPSFTRVMTQKIREIMYNRNEVDVKDLYKVLLSEKSLQKQPLLLPTKGKILLKRLTTSSESPGLAPPFSAASTLATKQIRTLALEVDIPRPLNSTVLQAVTSWLNRESPTAVVDVRLAKRTLSDVASSQTLRRNLLQQEMKPMSTSPTMSPKSQNELVTVLTQLDELSEAGSPNDLTAQQALHLLELLREKVTSVNTLVQDVLASLGEHQLINLMAQELPDSDSLRSRIRSRLKVLGAEDGPQEQSGHINFPDGSSAQQRFRVGNSADFQVLVEYWNYEQNTGNDRSRIATKTARMAAILLEPKPTTFRTLPAVCYIHESLHGSRFGIAYRRPDGQPIGEYATLLDLFRVSKYVALDSRLKLGRLACEALLSLHSIGWYHKAIKSDNFIFFARESGENTLVQGFSSSKYELEEPYMVGFDCSRPAEAETRRTVSFTPGQNLYRHPDRWGRPGRFESHHDLYALGILLLEIGRWRALCQMADPKDMGFHQPNDPEAFRARILSEHIPILAHYVGNQYSSAVRSCIEKRDWTGMEEWQVQRFIRAEVLTKLQL